jgi:hypothetical protein
VDSRELCGGETKPEETDPHTEYRMLLGHLSLDILA